MAEKLNKIKDMLVFALSLEVNVILTLFLFDVDIWGSLWQVGRINIAVLFFYGWLWFIDLYLNNYSTSAIEEKRRLAKEGIYVQPEPVFKKKIVEPKAEPVVHRKPQPKPQPIVQPEPAPEPAPKLVIQPKPQPVVQPEPEPIVQPEPIVEGKVEEEFPWAQSDQTGNITTNTDVVYYSEDETTRSSNLDDLLSWIEDDDQGGI